MHQRGECVKTPGSVLATCITIIKAFVFPSAKGDICDMVSLFKRASSLDL